MVNQLTSGESAKKNAEFCDIDCSGGPLETAVCKFSGVLLNVFQDISIISHKEFILKNFSQT